jgi:hypothetical protein
MNLNSPETVVRNATERYNEERYKFYKQMERLVPLIEELGRLKLSTWSKYTAMFDTLDKLINLPGHYTYKSHKNLHMLPQDVRKLRKVADVVKRIHTDHLDIEGTGMLTIVALQGGAASDYSQTALAEGESRLILEQIMEQPLYTSECGVLDEEQVLCAVMDFPKVMPRGYFKDRHGRKRERKVSKRAARRYKELTDKESVRLADATARADRLFHVVTHVLGYMKPLKKEHDEQLDFFTALIKKNNDYDQFTLEQKDRLNFGVTLGFVLRELARTDIIIKNGNVPIINTSALRAVYARAKDLMPAEEMPYQI